MKKSNRENEVLESLVETVGQEQVSALMLKFGGRRLRIPRSLESKVAHELCEVIGVDGLQKLIKVFGGQEFYLKKGYAKKQAARDRAICDRADFLTRDVARGGEGLSFRRATSRLVDEFGLSDRWIEAIINRGCE
ncbi:Mor transcription activator family protein [Zoogloea sp.]|uniref:Mor transcription activator family protein n=1 Tax=Zoogloea sp. TaxID=49181 RepID=UPI0025E0D556|nr:Mor transcription activator family protein [Zoogloea sp.]MCK6396488.1 hypothetical protein [Zoogloea sp.]